MDEKRVNVDDIRQIVREELLRGVPEFALRTATKKYVEELRRMIVRYVLVHKSGSSIERREALAAANEVLEQLEEKANDLVEEELWLFIRRI